MSEQWRRVPGASMYEASDLGRIRSYFGSNGRPVPDVIEGTPRNGYARVRIIADDGSRRFRVVHRLVAETFLGAPSDESHVVVRHLDDDQTNNHVSNLAWGTQADNVADSLRNGHNYSASKTHCGYGHPYDEANTYWAPSGGRACRVCRKRRVREGRKCKPSSPLTLEQRERKTELQRARRAHARNLLDISPAGSQGTLRALVESRLAELSGAES